MSCVGSYPCVGLWFLMYLFSQPGATTRKSAVQADRQNSEVPYYADDEDANRKKYSRRGVLKSLSAI